MGGARFRGLGVLLFEGLDFRAGQEREILQ
jgi:hypothetical protein